MLRRQDVGNCQLDTAGEQTSDPEGGSGEGTQIEAWRRKSIENKGIHTRVVWVTVLVCADWWVRELFAGAGMLESKSKFLSNPKIVSWTG